MYKLEELNTKKVTDLQIIAKKLNIKKFDKLNKEELAYAILDHQAENAKLVKKPKVKLYSSPQIRPAVKSVFYTWNGLRAA